MFAVVMVFLAPILHSSCNLLDSHFANNLIKSNSAIIFYNSLTNVVAIPFLLLFGVLLHRFYGGRFRESVHPRHILKKYGVLP